MQCCCYAAALQCVLRACGFSRALALLAPFENLLLFILISFSRFFVLNARTHHNAQGIKVPNSKVQTDRGLRTTGLRAVGLDSPLDSVPFPFLTQLAQHFAHLLHRQKAHVPKIFFAEARLYLHLG